MVFQIRAGELSVLLWRRAKGAARGALVAAGWRTRRRRGARRLDPPAAGGQGRCARTHPPRAAGHAGRAGPLPRPAGGRDGLPRARPRRRRPADPRRHAWYRVVALPPDGLRPRDGSWRRASPAAVEAVLHQPRFRARSPDVHHVGAGRLLPRGDGIRPSRRPTCSGSCSAAARSRRPAARPCRAAPVGGRRRCSGSGPATWRSPTPSPCSIPPAHRSRRRCRCGPGAGPPVPAPL